VGQRVKVIGVSKNDVYTHIQHNLSIMKSEGTKLLFHWIPKFTTKLKDSLTDTNFVYLFMMHNMDDIFNCMTHSVLVFPVVVVF